MTQALDIYAGGKRVAVLERTPDFLYRFSYLPRLSPKDAVSLTMPVNTDYEEFQVVPPALQVNLPEGFLLNTLQETAGKALKLDDDLDILALVGRHTIGRVQMVPSGEPLNNSDSPVIERAESLLRHADAKQILSHALEKVARYTSLSGVLPKGFAEISHRPKEGTVSISLSDSILKMETEECPGVCIVEAACLELSRRAGIPTVDSTLSESGEILLVNRFDLLPNGKRLGFEDFCSLTGVPKTAKYKRDLKHVAVTLEAFSDDRAQDNLAQLFHLTVLNTAIQNGDAHLKNFGVLYESPEKTPRLAPAYDLVNTTAWIHEDIPAIPMNGIATFPNRSELDSFGERFCHLTEDQRKDAFLLVAQAIVDSQKSIMEMEEGYEQGFRLRNLRKVTQSFLDHLREPQVFVEKGVIGEPDGSTATQRLPEDVMRVTVGRYHFKPVAVPEHGEIIIKHAGREKILKAELSAQQREWLQHHVGTSVEMQINREGNVRLRVSERSLEKEMERGPG